MIIVESINQAQSVLVSSLVAVFLAMLGTPALLWLERKRVPSVVAVLIFVTGMIAVLASRRHAVIPPADRLFWMRGWISPGAAGATS